MYKICFGIPAMGFSSFVNEEGFIEDFDFEDDVDPWCDFELIYYPDSKYYQLSFETMIGFHNKDGAKNWIKYCFNNLTDYMNKHEYDTTKELDLYQVFTEGINCNTKFESIEDVYAFMKLMVSGFNGQGLYTETLDE